MSPFPRLSFLFIITACFLAGCNDPVENNTLKEKKDTAANCIAATEKTQPSILKDVILNEKELIGKKRLSSAAPVDFTQYKLLALKTIDSTAGDENGFKYHIIDSLLSKTGLTVLLLGREYDTENIAWIALYDDQHKLLDQLQVYYDNAEGFLSVESMIKNNQVTVHTRNDFDEAKNESTIIYKLVNNKLEKL